MKIFTRFIVGLLVLLLLSPLPQAHAQSFSDVHQNKEEIDFLVNKQIINGYLDGTFRPTQNMTRIDGVRILLRVKGVTDFTAPDPKFTDLQPGTEVHVLAAKAAELGIISGKRNPDGTHYFDPNGLLTRGQMAKILVETMNFPLDSSFSFRDVSQSHGFAAYISTLATEGITEGYPDLTFRPDLPITRQQFSLFVARMLNDDFKPAPRPTSFNLNKKLIYVRTTNDQDQQKQLEEMRYIGPEYNGKEEWDLWMITGNGMQSIFVMRESPDDLQMGYPEGSSYTELSYPLYKGKTYTDGWNDTMTITDVNVTMTTKAGTFSQVVVVKSNTGATFYYAPNIGPIKSVLNGQTTMEVIELKTR